MTTVVEQTKGHEHREQALRSISILRQQIEQSTALSYAAKYWQMQATDVARLRF
jgi:hypothetical protein